MTSEEIEEYNGLPNSAILYVIEETQQQINQYERELEILWKNPKENKVEIYLRNGRILQRQYFISEMYNILNLQRIQNLIDNTTPK